jgi:hypothetical protein
MAIFARGVIAPVEPIDVIDSATILKWRQAALSSSHREYHFESERTFNRVQRRLERPCPPGSSTGPDQLELAKRHVGSERH